MKKHAIEQASKVIVSDLKKKKRKRSRSKERKKKAKKKQKKKAKKASPEPDPEIIADYLERNKRKRKPKDPNAFTDVDKMKELALKQLEPYTTKVLFNFNPLYAGDPDELVASRGERDIHVDKLFHHMQVMGSFYKKGVMVLVFWNVSSLF